MKQKTNRAWSMTDWKVASPEKVKTWRYILIEIEREGTYILFNTRRLVIVRVVLF